MRSSPNRKKGGLTAFLSAIEPPLLCHCLRLSSGNNSPKYSVREPLLLLKVYVLSLVLLKFLFCYILHVQLPLL